MLRHWILAALAGLAALQAAAQSRIDDFRLHGNHTRSWMQSYRPAGPAPEPLPRRAPRPAEAEAIAYAERLFESSEARGMALIDGGQVVWDRVKAPATRQSPFHAYSVTKSMLAVAMGKAVCDGLLAMDTRLGEHVPAFAPTALGRATVRDLLMMASGATSSDPSGSFPALVRAVDFGGPEDIESALLDGDTPKARRGLFGPYAPGEHFDYKNTDPEALGLLFHRKTGRPLAGWWGEALLAPAGVAGPVYFGADRKGHTNSSYGMRMPLEDWSRVAVWVKAQSKAPGCFGDQLRAAMKRQIRNLDRRTGGPWAGYGHFFWTDAREAPGSVWALGHGGQRIAWSEKNDRILIVFSVVENFTSEGLRLFDLWNRAEGP